MLSVIDECPSRHIPVIFLGSKGNTFKHLNISYIAKLPSGVVTEISALTNNLWDYNHRIIFNYIKIGEKEQMRSSNSEIKILLQFLSSSSEPSLNFTFDSEIWHALGGIR